MIKIDMEIPVNCMECPIKQKHISHSWNYRCVVARAVFNKDIKLRHSACPLIEAKTDNDVKKLKYERLREEMNGWPDWKKKAYNEMFATSTHSEKLEVKE